MWSASSPWPVISWKRTPPKPPPTTTGIAPAGAGSASSSVSATCAARSADALGRAVLDELEAPVAAERLEAGLDGPVAPRDHLHPEPHPRSVVAREAAVRVRDGDEPAALRVARHDLGDLVAGGSRGLVARSKQLGLALGRDVGRAASRSPAGWPPGRLRAPAARCARSASRRRDRVGRALEVLLPESVDVGEVGRLAAHDAHPCPALGSALHPLDARLVDGQAEPGALLAEDLGEVAAVLAARGRPRPRRAQRRSAAGALSLIGRGAPSRARRFDQRLPAARNSARPASVSGG